MIIIASTAKCGTQSRQMAPEKIMQKCLSMISPQTTAWPGYLRLTDLWEFHGLSLALHCGQGLWSPKCGVVLHNSGAVLLTSGGALDRSSMNDEPAYNIYWYRWAW